MTKAQNSLYWREWGAVRKVKKDADRHELHIQALGADKSHDDFCNADFDKVLGVFRAISRPADLDAQLRQINQPKTRRHYKLGEFPPNYVAVVSRAKFGHDDLDRLTPAQLRQLNITLTERRRSKDRKAKASQPSQRCQEPF